MLDGARFSSHLYFFNLLLGELYPRENEVIPKSENAVADDRVLKFLVWRRLTSCWILSSMSPEIQEWSHKSRSRINNPYLLTRPIKQHQSSAQFHRGIPKRWAMSPWAHEPMSQLIECRLFDEQTMSRTVSANEYGSYSMSPQSRGSLAHRLCGSFNLVFVHFVGSVTCCLCFWFSDQ